MSLPKWAKHSWSTYCCECLRVTDVLGFPENGICTNCTDPNPSSVVLAAEQATKTNPNVQYLSSENLQFPMEMDKVIDTSIRITGDTVDADEDRELAEQIMAADLQTEEGIDSGDRDELEVKEEPRSDDGPFVQPREGPEESEFEPPAGPGVKYDEDVKIIVEPTYSASIEQRLQEEDDALKAASAAQETFADKVRAFSSGPGTLPQAGPPTTFGDPSLSSTPRGAPVAGPVGAAGISSTPRGAPVAGGADVPPSSTPDSSSATVKVEAQEGPHDDLDAGRKRHARLVNLALRELREADAQSGPTGFRKSL